MMETDNRASVSTQGRALLFWAAAAAMVLAIALAGYARSDAWAAGFSGADESAHFLNALAVGDYLAHPGGNPIAHARALYLHYPKISIGHWPPFFYAVEGSAFALAGPSWPLAMAINLLVSTVAALLAAGAAARLAPRPLALAGAGLLALTPIWLESLAFLMLDEAVALLAALAALAWHRYAATGGWRPLLLFAALAAATILTKGNGWLLGLVPPIHAALTGQGRRLIAPRAIAAASLLLAVVGPWYWLTAGIASDGFNYRPGAAYAARSLAANIGYLAANLSPPGLLLAIAGAIFEHRARRIDPPRWRFVAVWIALLLATLIFQSIVPTDITDRYMAPALVPLVVLALIGAWRIAAMLPTRWSGPALAAMLLVCALPGLIHLATRPAKIDFRLAAVAGGIAPAARPTLWLIDGSSGAEGALIAEVAMRDPARSAYILRSSKLLTESDFMGRSYRLNGDDRAVLDKLDRLGVAGIVTVRQQGVDPLPHSVQLARALAGSQYAVTARLPHRNRPGITTVYRRPAPVAPDLALLGEISGVPRKAAIFR